MSSRKCIVHFYEEDNGERRWRCGKYLMCSSVQFKMTSDRCYHYRCPGRQDYIPPREKCAWKDCDKPVALNKLRHCSETCRKRDNRWAYRQRQKEKEAQIKRCDWKDCNNPVAPNKVRHCSETCRKRDNRWAYRQRQILKKQGVLNGK